MIVAIDGPSGAGKSTVAKAVAKTLGFSCLDTGAMYRAVAWWALNHGVSLEDVTGLEEIAKTQNIEFMVAEGEVLPRRVFIGGFEVTSAIRTAEIDRAVSAVAVLPEVRRELVLQQQRIGKTGNYVVEGRDIGTCVFPDAEVKIFLTATDEERAHRRVRQNVDRGIGSISFEEVLADIKRRDEVDSSRSNSPLAAAPDAILLDSTNLYIEDIIKKICEIARVKM